MSIDSIRPLDAGHPSPAASDGPLHSAMTPWRYRQFIAGMTLKQYDRYLHLRVGTQLSKELARRLALSEAT